MCLARPPRLLRSDRLQGGDVPGQGRGPCYRHCTRGQHRVPNGLHVACERKMSGAFSAAGRGFRENDDTLQQKAVNIWTHCV